VGPLLGEGAPAFWPWVQVVRAYVQSTDPTEFGGDMGPGAADIAQVVPAVRDRLPDLPTPPQIEPEAARFRLFDSLAGFLRAAAARRPPLLILDDLHGADAPSLALLRFVSRELERAGPLVVGIYRQAEVDRGHPLLATLADLTRGRRRRQLLLGGLGRRDVASFVALVAGATPSWELVAALHQQTDGNPFFVTEVVRLLLAGLQAAGLEDIGGEVHTSVVAGGTENWVRGSIQQLGARLTSAGLVSSDEVARILALAADGSSHYTPPFMVTAWGRRPPA
jgi:AAA ATPase domain